MSIYAVTRIVVLLLVLVPLASAVLMPVFGRAARRISLLVAFLHLGLTAVVVTMAVPTINYREEHAKQQPGDTLQAFSPEFVPGDSGARFNSDATEGRTHWTLFRLSATEPPRSQPGARVQFFLGVDGLNVWLAALASFMLIPVILISWDSIQEKPGAFYGWLFLLQTGLIGCFLSFDVILFYIFFELTLIPAFFLIGRWGVGSGRRDAARKFFLYTLAGSLLTLLGVIGIVLTNPSPIHPSTGVRVDQAVVLDQSEVTARASGEWVMAKSGSVTFSLPDLMANVQVWATAPDGAKRALKTSEAELTAARTLPKSAENDARVQTANRKVESAKKLVGEAEQLQAKNFETQFWLFIALMAGFMVKVPIWPFHTWLPAAYGEAPIGVTMLLSAIMAKLGTFGILRLVLPLVPDAAIVYGLPVVGALAAVGIVYAAFCAFASKDIKLLIAYSSISHLGFLVLALFAFNREGVSGSVLHMVNHGLSTGALFAALGFLLIRYRTTEMPKFGGLMGRFPTFAVLVFVLSLASVGLPGLNNFVSEMMMMAGLFAADNPGVRGLWPAIVAVVGIFLSAWYTLTMLRRVFFNPLKLPEPVVYPGQPEGVRDVTRREFYALGSLAALCLVLGLWPQPVIDSLKPDVRIIANIGDAARARVTKTSFVSKEPFEPQSASPSGAEPAPNPKGPPAKAPPAKVKEKRKAKSPVAEE